MFAHEKVGNSKPAGGFRLSRPMEGRASQSHAVAGADFELPDAIHRSPDSVLPFSTFNFELSDACLTATVAKSEADVNHRQERTKQFSDRNKNGLSGFRPIPATRRFASLALLLLLLAAPLFAMPSTKSLCDSPGACPCSKMAAMRGAAQYSDPSNVDHAQSVRSQSGMQMPGMNSQGSQSSGTSMPGMNMAMPMAMPANFIQQILNHESAGTSAEPDSTPHAMLMSTHGPWTLMFHGTAFVNGIQQSGPRGADKVFSTSWLMPMAQRELGPGTLTLRGMFSLEPATVTGREYPELFQVGETAFGNPIVDGQHPHNFFMELAALYDLKLGDNTLLSLYAAPVGDPAIGPEAFPHRVSASEDPLGTLGHHLQDSTHISYDVVTLGLAYKIARVEVSGFHGREPGENRWTIGAGNIDSWATRLTVNPAQDWSGQYSIARLHSPESLFPGEDTLRMTASVTYDRPVHSRHHDNSMNMGNTGQPGDSNHADHQRGMNHAHSMSEDDWGNLATTLLWGRNEDLPGGEVFNSYLFESALQFARRNYAWTRIENVDRTNLLLLGENPLPAAFEEHFLARVQAYTLGYDREFRVVPRVSSAFGGQVTLYSTPPSLDAIYGAHPTGVLIFLRLRPAPSAK
jgi:hypothetical protein